MAAHTTAVLMAALFCAIGGRQFAPVSAQDSSSLTTGCPIEGNSQLVCSLGGKRIHPGHLAPVDSVCRDVTDGVDMYCAQDGTWTRDGRGHELTRQKRSVALIPAIISAIGSVIGPIGDLIFGAIEMANRDSPPQIVCPANYAGYSKPLETTLQYQLDKLAASDDKGIQREPECSPKSGSTFQEGQHNVKCWVADTKGQLAFCDFTITVNVRRCPRLSWPDNGFVSCPNGAVLGATCTLACDEGYQPQGASSSECMGLDWSVPIFRCKPKQCKQLPHVENGDITCPPVPVYQTVCHVTCNPGFRLRGTSSVVCLGDDGFTAPALCEDVDKPIFPNGCPEDVEAYAAPLVNRTMVSWAPPAVLDNSGNTSLTCTHDPSYGFTPGRHTVLCTARDSANNLAACSFQVVIKTLSCPMPSFDKSGKDLLLYSCPQGRLEGAQCKVSCRSGYPLVGPDTLYCDRDDSTYPPNAQWTTRDTTSPVCREIVCPPLAQPLNGALACLGWDKGETCSISCNEHFDIPEQLFVLDSREFVCGNSDGTWRPTNVVPGCTERRQLGSMRLRSVLYYFSGDCSDPSTQEQIKKNFIESLKVSKYREACINVPECRVDRVLVRCGPVSTARRRRRSTGVSIVTFEIIVKLPEGMNSSQAVSNVRTSLNGVASVLKQEAANRVFDMTVNGQVLRGENLTTETPQVTCGNGSKLHLGLICAGCAPGSYLNSSVDVCQDCPLDHYEDKGYVTACKSCPPFTSTNGTGKTSVNDCLPQCGPGWVSDSGLEPCQQCPVGSFQPSWRQTGCLQCPSNFSTAQPASTSIDQCLDVTGCASSPCGSHSCLAIPGGWRCQCHGGWTGADCGTPPNLCLQHQCQNNATCVPGLRNYTCTCERGFNGELCSVRIRDGGWSAWGQWSECSASCGGGTTSRQRLCNSPPPDREGKACPGNSTETEMCQTQRCPTCPSLPQPHGVTWNCTEEGELTSCTKGCQDGLMMPVASSYVYQCGLVTNYSWNFGSPELLKIAQQDCTEPHLPAEIWVQVSTTVRLGCREAHANEASIQDKVRNASQKLDCVQNRQCRVEVSLGECPTPDPGNSTNVTLTLISNSSSSTGRVNLTGDIDSTDPSAVRTRHYVDLLKSIALSLQQILDNQSFLTVEVGGRQYPPSDYGYSGGVTCPLGTVPSDVACGECPKGTRQLGVQCVLCAKDSYADSTGSTICTACPSGLTTNGTGSTSSSQCLADGNSDSSSEDNADSREEVNKDLLKIVVPVAGTFVGLIVIVGSIALVICIHRRSLCFKTISRYHTNSKKAMEDGKITLKDLEGRSP